MVVKFIYSEKATKFCEIFPLLLSVCTVDKSKGKISQNRPSQNIWTLSPLYLPSLVGIQIIYFSYLFFPIFLWFSGSWLWILLRLYGRPRKVEYRFLLPKFGRKQWCFLLWNRTSQILLHKKGQSYSIRSSRVSLHFFLLISNIPSSSRGPNNLCIGVLDAFHFD